MNYRREIDGLRAIAVLPVILFHAGFSVFSGGFVGVDVFFVISGYLITTIILSDLEQERFSIVDFYERRARRIIPALFFVVFLCIPFAWMWMLPSQMTDFSQSLVAVTLFVSNILFWRESDYFAAAAEEKPLLHTWSLAVEEQYYLLFPVFLFLAWRFGKNRVFWMIVIFSGISLLLSQWGARKEPVANFYLAPTRAWELFAGSIAAFMVAKRGVQKNDALAMVGLLAILVAIFAYDEKTPFPSAYALLPVVGVVLLVLFGHKETLAARFLSYRLFVGVGLISYSAYLWHQPLFAFARINSLEEPSPYLMAGLAGVSLCLAVASWKYVETPFRNKQTFDRKRIFSLSLAVMVAALIIGYYGYRTDGFTGRFSEGELALMQSAAPNPKRSECHSRQDETALEKAPCVYFSGEPRYAVLGNSHATELAYSMAKRLEGSGQAVVHHSITRCWHNYHKADEADSICGRWHAKVVGDIASNTSVDSVIVSYRNEEYLDQAEYRRALVDILSVFVNAGKQVVLVLQAPLPGAHIDKYIQIALRDKLSDMDGLSRSQWDEIYQSKDSLLAEIPSEVAVVDPAALFCSEGACAVIKNKQALYFDDDHMSLYGSGLVADVILDSVLQQ